MRKSIKRNIYNKKRYTRRKGGGIGFSKVTYPPLPPSPPSTPRNNKPFVLTNNESLTRVKPGSKEYEERKARLLNMKRRAHTQTFINKIMRREQPKVSLNSFGYPKSAFNINKNRGFKPNS
jgi:hypothetical protein